MLSYYINKMSNEAYNFKVEPNRYIGTDFSIFRDDLYSVALATPSKYFKNRQEVQASLKKEAVSKLYDTLYDFMTNGKVGEAQIADSNGRDLKPNYPPTKMNEIILGIASTLSESLSLVLDEIMPIQYKTLAQDRLLEKGQANAE